MVRSGEAISTPPNRLLIYQKNHPCQAFPRQLDRILLARCSLLNCVIRTAYEVQGKYDTWQLPCSRAESRILADFASVYLITENGWLITFHGLIGLCTAHRLHRRNAAAAFLDGGDSRLPPPAQLRARFLFSVFGVVPVLRRFPPPPVLPKFLPPPPHRRPRNFNSHNFPPPFAPSPASSCLPHC